MTHPILFRSLALQFSPASLLGIPIQIHLKLRGRREVPFLILCTSTHVTILETGDPLLKPSSVVPFKGGLQATAPFSFECLRIHWSEDCRSKIYFWKAYPILPSFILVYLCERDLNKTTAFIFEEQLL
ncbi:hypothetical protein PanWU01x14_144380 [Parasponia andersonii]|uniref:Uncharacterized protein n=1 Tax=Parasponia andersonii TaxID=3476 RepID=A0A2P5CL75_PARAD|nr:hypothetical protein PanWU01x14_144380 [Parasponia andersonii]